MQVLRPYFQIHHSSIWVWAASDTKLIRNHLWCMHCEPSYFTSQSKGGYSRATPRVRADRPPFFCQLPNLHGNAIFLQVWTVPGIRPEAYISYLRRFADRRPPPLPPQKIDLCASRGSRTSTLSIRIREESLIADFLESPIFEITDFSRSTLQAKTQITDLFSFNKVLTFSENHRFENRRFSKSSIFEDRIIWKSPFFQESPMLENHWCM